MQPTLEDRALNAAVRCGLDVDAWITGGELSLQTDEHKRLTCYPSTPTAGVARELYVLASGIVDGSAGRSYPGYMMYDYDILPDEMQLFCTGLAYGHAIRKMFKEPV